MPSLRSIKQFYFKLKLFHVNILFGRFGTHTLYPVGPAVSENRKHFPAESSVADPDPVGSGPFSRIRIRSNFPDPDPTIKQEVNLIS